MTMATAALMQGTRERRVRLIFRLGIALKAIDGVIELVASGAMALLPGAALATIVEIVTRRELSEDPNDWIANALVEGVHRISGDSWRFAIAYLFAHGIVKVMLAVSLWQEKIWAYRVALPVLCIFTAYQCYRLVHTRSLILLAFTAVDLFIIWAVWRDYRLKIAMGAAATQGAAS